MVDVARRTFFANYAKTHALEAHGLEKLEEFGAFTQDTRKLEKNDIYVALRGENFDGHSFCKQAAASGAACLVVEEKQDVETPQIVVADSLKFLQEFAHAYRESLSATVIGLTGTNGKTTCKEMIYAVLSPQFKTAKTEGNYNNHIGVPLTLANIPSDVEIAIVEMGTNHPGEIDFLAELSAPDISFVTCVGYGHMEFFASLEAVAQEKTSIFKFTKKTVILNQFDPHLKDAPVTVETKRIGADSSSDFVLKQAGLNKSGGAVGQVNSVSFDLQIAGKHHSLNAAFAIACGLLCGVAETDLTERVNAFAPVSGRMERITVGNYTIFNDAYNANPNSMLAACEFFEELETDNPKIMVLGDMLELGETAQSQHERIADSLVGTRSRVFLVGETFASINTSFTKEHDLGKISKEILDEVEHATILLKGSRGMRLERLIDHLNASEAAHAK